MQNDALCNRYAFAYILGEGTDRFLTKTMRVMQLTAIFLTVCCLSVTARTVSQTVTYKGDKVPLKTVFQAIEKQTGYFVLFNDELVSHSKPVSIVANQMPLVKFLNQILLNEFLTYSIQNTTITIERKNSPPNSSPRQKFEISAPPITGIIRGPEGQPLVGVNIIIKGTKKGTTSSSNGKFSIDAKEGDILIVTSIGYELKEIPVGAYNEIGIVQLALAESKLDEVQIIAYGTTSRRLSTSTISSVKAEDIQKQPISNPLLALQGRVSGIVVTQSNGNSGADVNVQIRGKNSIQSGNDPFYVIDGVPYNSQMLTSSVGGPFGGNGSPFSYLNSSDIESIDILKDADATSIYGSRASNGAILITTKKGKIGKTKVDVDLQSGWSRVPREIKLLNTEQYLQLRNEAITNDNGSVSTSDYDINGVWDTTRNTNWQKELIGNTAHFTNMHAALSGGNAQTQFLVGAGYIRETSIFSGNFTNDKGSVNFNVNHNSSDRRFQFQLSANYLNGNNKLPNIDLTASALNLPPDAPALYNNDGSLNWEPLPNGTSTFSNPANVLEWKYNDRTTNLISNALLSYELMAGLKLKSSFGYNNITTKEQTSIPITFWDPNGFFKERMARYANKSNTGYIIEPQLQYNKDFNLGKVDVLVGSSFQENRSELMAFAGSGYNTDAELDNIRAAATLTVVGSIQNLYKYNALFGRLNYNYKDKYIINFNARRDGSSRFGSENRFHNFYSVGGAWIFSEETLVKSSLPFISFGKFSASYGTTGNDQIPDYGYLNLFSPVTVGVPYQGAAGIAPNGHTNPFLQWELTKKTNLGLDLGLFSNRILLSANYYSNVSSNQLMQSPIPIQTGFSFVQENFPATIRNSGWEFELNARLVKHEKFNWNSSFNLTFPKNKLISFPDLATSGYANTMIIGESINIRKLYKYAGVNQQTGTYEFFDHKGQITSNPNSIDDNFTVINLDSKFYGGWHNNISYEEFELDFLFSFNKKTGRNEYFRFGNFPGYSSNQPITVLQRWQQPGDVANMQRANADFSLFNSIINAQSSDAAYTDVSYASLKNVSLSYTFPKKLIAKLRMNQARLFVQGQNLLVITRFKGLDPENTENTRSIPPLRVITMGIHLNF